jgi:hypothetical protein
MMGILDADKKIQVQCKIESLLGTVAHAYNYTRHESTSFLHISPLHTNQCLSVLSGKIKLE